MLGHILIEFLDTIFVNLAVIGEVGDESGQAIFSLEDVNLIMQGLYLFADELRDIDGFFFIVYVHILVFVDRFNVQFFLIGLEHLIQLLDDLLLVLQQLVVDTLSQSHQIVEDLIVILIEFFEHNDVLVALLFGLGYNLEEVDVGGLVVLEEVLLGVLDDAVGTQRHQALAVAAEIGQEFVGMVGAVDLADLGVLGERGLVDA